MQGTEYHENNCSRKIAVKMHYEIVRRPSFIGTNWETYNASPHSNWIWEGV